MLCFHSAILDFVEYRLHKIFCHATTTLETVAPSVWAYFRQLSGKEVFAAATINYKEDVLFQVNYDPAITATHVIRYRGILYDITRVDTFEGYKSDLVLYCTRRARQN